MDELDLYDDLDEFQEQHERKSKELKDLEEKLAQSLKNTENLRKENEVLKKNIRRMELGFQSLLDTARAEIGRKNKEIERLNKEKDDICFRRNIHFKPANTNEKPQVQQHTFINPFSHGAAKDKISEQIGKIEKTADTNKEKRLDSHKRYRVKDTNRHNSRDFNTHHGARTYHEEKCESSPLAAARNCDAIKDNPGGRNRYVDKETTEKNFSRSRSRDQKDYSENGNKKSYNKYSISSHTAERSYKRSGRSSSRERDKDNNKYQTVDGRHHKKIGESSKRNVSKSTRNENKSNSVNSNRDYTVSKNEIKIMSEEKTKSDDLQKTKNDKVNSEIFKVNISNKPSKQEITGQNKSDENLEKESENNISLDISLNNLNPSTTCETDKRLSSHKAVLFKEIFGKSPSERSDVNVKNSTDSNSFLNNLKKDIHESTSQVNVLSSATTSPGDYTDLSSCISTPINKTIEVIATATTTPVDINVIDSEAIVNRDDIEKCFIPTENKKPETIACMDMKKVAQILDLDFCTNSKENITEANTNNSHEISVNFVAVDKENCKEKSKSAAGKGMENTVLNNQSIAKHTSNTTFNEPLVNQDCSSEFKHNHSSNNKDKNVAISIRTSEVAEGINSCENDEMQIKDSSCKNILTEASLSTLTEKQNTTIPKVPFNDEILFRKNFTNKVVIIDSLKSSGTFSLKNPYNSDNSRQQSKNDIQFEKKLNENSKLQDVNNVECETKDKIDATETSISFHLPEGNKTTDNNILENKTFHEHNFAVAKTHIEKCTAAETTCNNEKNLCETISNVATSSQEQPLSKLSQKTPKGENNLPVVHIQIEKNSTAGGKAKGNMNEKVINASDSTIDDNFSKEKIDDSRKSPIILDSCNSALKSESPFDGSIKYSHTKRTSTISCESDVSMEDQKTPLLNEICLPTSKVVPNVATVTNVAESIMDVDVAASKPAVVERKNRNQHEEKPNVIENTLLEPMEELEHSDVALGNFSESDDHRLFSLSSEKTETNTCNSVDQTCNRISIVTQAKKFNKEIPKEGAIAVEVDAENKILNVAVWEEKVKNCETLLNNNVLKLLRTGKETKEEFKKYCLKASPTAVENKKPSTTIEKEIAKCHGAANNNKITNLEKSIDSVNKQAAGESNVSPSETQSTKTIGCNIDDQYNSVRKLQQAAKGNTLIKKKYPADSITAIPFKTQQHFDDKIQSSKMATENITNLIAENVKSPTVVESSCSVNEDFICKLEKLEEICDSEINHEKLKSCRPDRCKILSVIEIPNQAKPLRDIETSKVQIKSNENENENVCLERSQYNIDEAKISHHSLDANVNEPGSAALPNLIINKTKPDVANITKSISGKKIFKEINIEGEIVEVVGNISNAIETSNTPISAETRSYDYNAGPCGYKTSPKKPEMFIAQPLNGKEILLNEEVQLDTAQPQLSNTPFEAAVETKPGVTESLLVSISPNNSDMCNTNPVLPSISTTSPTPSNFSGIFSKKSAFFITTEDEVIKSKKKSTNLSAKHREYILPAASVLCNVDNLENATKANKKLHWELLDNKNETTEMTEVEDDADIDTTDDNESIEENVSISPNQDNFQQPLHQPHTIKVSETDAKTENDTHLKNLRHYKVHKIKQRKHKLPKTVRAKVKVIGITKDLVKTEPFSSVASKRPVGRPRKTHSKFKNEILGVTPQKVIDNCNSKQECSRNLILGNKIDACKEPCAELQGDVQSLSAAGNCDNVEKYEYEKNCNENNSDNSLEHCHGNIPGIMNNLENCMKNLSTSVEKLEICDEPCSVKCQIADADNSSLNCHKKDTSTDAGNMRSTEKLTTECITQLSEKDKSNLTNEQKCIGKHNVSPNSHIENQEETLTPGTDCLFVDKMMNSSIPPNGDNFLEQHKDGDQIENNMQKMLLKNKSSTQLSKTNSVANKERNYISLQDIGNKIRSPHLSSCRILKTKNDHPHDSWRLESYVELKNQEKEKAQIKSEDEQMSKQHIKSSSSRCTVNAGNKTNNNTDATIKTKCTEGFSDKNQHIRKVHEPKPIKLRHKSINFPSHEEQTDICPSKTINTDQRVLDATCDADNGTQLNEQKTLRSVLSKNEARTSTETTEIEEETKMTEESKLAAELQSDNLKYIQIINKNRRNQESLKPIKTLKMQNKLCVKLTSAMKSSPESEKPINISGTSNQCSDLKTNKNENENAGENSETIVDQIKSVKSLKTRRKSTYVESNSSYNGENYKKDRIDAMESMTVKEDATFNKNVNEQTLAEYSVASMRNSSTSKRRKSTNFCSSSISNTVNGDLWDKQDLKTEKILKNSDKSKRNYTDITEQKSCSKFTTQEQKPESNNNSKHDNISKYQDYDSCKMLLEAKESTDLSVKKKFHHSIDKKARSNELNSEKNKKLEINAGNLNKFGEQKVNSSCYRLTHSVDTNNVLKNPNVKNISEDELKNKSIVGKSHLDNEAVVPKEKFANLCQNLEHTMQEKKNPHMEVDDSDCSVKWIPRKINNSRRKSTNKLRILDSSSEDDEPPIQKATVISSEIKTPLKLIEKRKQRRRCVVKSISTSMESPINNINSTSQQSNNQTSPLTSPWLNHSIFNTEVTPQSASEIVASLSITSNQHDDKFKEIDSKLQAIFKSPEYSVGDDRFSATVVEPKLKDLQSSLNNSQSHVSIDETIDLNGTTTQNCSNITQINESMASAGPTTSMHNNSEIKHLSLGSAEYRFEKVSDNVVNLFISRKRKRKCNN